MWNPTIVKDTLTGTYTQTGWLVLALADTPTYKVKVLQLICFYPSFLDGYAYLA